MKNIKITIGIPAHNEDQNIGLLLMDILRQKEHRFEILEIIIVSDKSSDKTLSTVKQFRDKRIKIYENRLRMGQALTQNKIARLSKGDILVLLNADIRIPRSSFVKTLISPMLKEQNIGIVSPKIVALKGTNLFERVINFSVGMKNSIYVNKSDGHNLYLCHGRARAIRKSLYKRINWPRIASEDAFSYLFALEKNNNFYYQDKTYIYYKSPENFMDHQRQSTRFLNSKNELKKFFKHEILKESYHLPILKVIPVVLNRFIKNPLYLTIYTLLLLRIKISNNSNGYIWETSKSSKLLA